jgi:hypothetical protein
MTTEQRNMGYAIKIWLSAATLTILGIAISTNNKVTGMENRVSSLQDTIKATKRAVETNMSTIMGAYQLTIDSNICYMWDGTRLVGKFKLDYDKDPISTMILEDNN